MLHNAGKVTSYLSDYRYAVMMKCWQEDPNARPTFVDLRNQLKEMENQHKVNKIRTKLFSFLSKINVINLVIFFVNGK